MKLTDEQSAFVEAIRDFAQRECGTREQRSALTDGGKTAHSPEIAKKMADLGWLGMAIPDDDIKGYTDADPALDAEGTMSIAGRLPLLTVLMGEAYELAVHALDLASAGAPEPPPRLLQAGIAALADVTGALAASTKISGSAVLFTPDGGWEFESCSHGWATTRLDPGKRPPGAGVSGAADVLLDASSGRNNPVTQLARRRLKVHDLPGLLRLTPIVEVAPNIPGGHILRFAARALSGGSKRLRD